MKTTRSIAMSGLCIAIGIVIVTVLKNFGGQPVLRLFSPMHFPVLLAGLTIGPIEGFVVGLLTPLLSYFINGLPPVGPWAMMAELATYGLVCGWGMNYLHRVKGTAKIYWSLIVSMILGRITGGLVTGFVLNGGNYSLSLWIQAYFVSTAAAIVTDLVVIPILVRALQKANLSVK